MYFSFFTFIENKSKPVNTIYPQKNIKNLQHTLIHHILELTTHPCPS